MRLAVFCALSLAAWAADPAFEVTSVKLNHEPVGQRHIELKCSADGRFTALGLALDAVLLYAFNIDYYQFPNPPPLVTSQQAIFDIEGRPAKAVSEGECRQMAQSLLVDRFRLAMHWETRSIRVYALLPGRNGSKMIKTTADTKDPGQGVVINGFPAYGPRTTGFSMPELAALIGRWTSSDAPVVDRTGFEGRYKISVEVTVSSTPGETTDVATVAQQLGLRVEDRKEPIHVLTIDHIQMPDEN